MMEAMVVLAVLVRSIDFELIDIDKIRMTSGATIHTADGLNARVSMRQQ